MASTHEESVGSDTLVCRRGDDQASAVEPAVPHRVGRFIILEELGRGGMGVVYAAYDPDLDRKAAVKLLHTRADDPEGRERDQARLLREAQAMARLSHPNVAAVYEVGVIEGLVFLAMEFIEGTTLRQWVERSSRPGGWRTIVSMFRQAGAGLGAAHRAGLVHRDFKPDNVLVDTEGRARVLDFGLARAGAGEGEGEPPTMDSAMPSSSSEFAIPLTEVGQVMGTPAYMAPEQYLGASVDGRTDQYSFCVALYEALYGVRPFVGADLLALREHVLHGQPAAAPSQADVPTWVHQVILRGLRRVPADRFESMDALLDRLGRDPGARRRRIARWVVAGLLAGGGAWGYQAYLQSQFEQSVAASDPCAGAEARLEGVWDDPRKRVIEEVFTGTGLEHAPQTWSRVEARLDRYTARWSAAQRAICRATKVEHRQPEALLDTRQACLNRRLSELRAHTTVLARADREVVNTAFEVIDALRDPDECREVQSMHVEVPLPQDEQNAARVIELRRELDDVGALASAGQHDEALLRAREVVTAAETLEYLPLVAEAQLRLGNVLQHRGQFDEAAAAFDRALWAAEVGRHDAAAVDSWTQWLRTVGYLQDQHAVAQAMVPRLDAAMHRLGDDEVRRARVLKAQGTLAFATGDDQAALPYFRAALEIVQHELGPRHSRTLSLQQNLGTILYRLGRLEEARRVLESALVSATQAHGEHYPYLGSLHLSLGGLARRRKLPQIAQHHYQRGLELFGAAHPDSHPGHAKFHRALGGALADLGLFEEALAHHRDALAAEHRATGGPMPPYDTLFALSRVLVALDRSAEAIPHLEYMLADSQVARGEPLFVAHARGLLAYALWDLRPRSRARARALATEAQDYYVAHPQVEVPVELERWLASRPTR